MYLIHYDDKKGKHEIALDCKQTELFDINLKDFYSLDLFDNIGYGASKEEAYENYKQKYLLALKELNEFGKKLESNEAYEFIKETRDLIF